MSRIATAKLETIDETLVWHVTTTSGAGLGTLSADPHDTVRACALTREVLTMGGFEVGPVLVRGAEIVAYSPDAGAYGPPADGRPVLGAADDDEREAYATLVDDWEEPTLEQEFAGRMDAADRAARMEHAAAVRAEAADQAEADERVIAALVGLTTPLGAGGTEGARPHQLQHGSSWHNSAATIAAALRRAASALDMLGDLPIATTALGISLQALSHAGVAPESDRIAAMDALGRAFGTSVKRNAMRDGSWHYGNVGDDREFDGVNVAIYGRVSAPEGGAS